MSTTFADFRGGVWGVGLRLPTFGKVWGMWGCALELMAVRAVSVAGVSLWNS